jgi:hypothetical protein
MARKQQEPAELVALDQTREEVKRTYQAYREAVRKRNMAAAKAKAAGHPAGTVYQRAGISQSTFSRRGGGAVDR